MMKSLLFQILLFMAALFLTGCEEIVNLDHLRPDPKIVINCLPETGSPVKASLSRTWFYSDPRPDVQAMDFQVNLYVNGTWHETLQPTDDTSDKLRKKYAGTYSPLVGDELRIVAETAGFKSAEGTTRIPEMPTLLDFERIVKIDTLQYEDVEHYIQGDINYKMKIQDKEKEQNYFMVRIEESLEEEWIPVTLDFIKEPIFSAQLSAFDKIMGYDYLDGYERAFTDDLFKDSEYTLQLKLLWGQKGDNGRSVLSHLSYEYYQYWYTLQARENNFNADLVNAGLGEPIRVYSNIKGGLGIMAGRSSVALTSNKQNTVIQKEKKKM
ncbi:MAG: DUF4249 domain-containing protein [Bacteroidales bacterium]